MENAKRFFGDKLEFAVVCEEDHAEQEPDPADLHPVPPGRHLHAIFALKNRHNLRGAHCLDPLANSHGKYEAAKSLPGSVNYVAKDGDFIAHGVDVEEYLAAWKKKTSTKATLMALEAKNGADLAKLDSLDPGFVLMHLQKLRAYILLQATLSQTPTLKWSTMTVPVGVLQPNLRHLANWLNSNLGQERVLRQKQLLLSSPPGWGKTTLIEELYKYFRIYQHVGGKWFDGFEDEATDLLVFDEFNGNVPLSVMNKVLDGQRCNLEVKGGSAAKNKRQPVIILTNYEEHELYQGEKVNASVRDAFFDRLLYIRLGTNEQPWRLIPFFGQGEANPLSMLDDQAEENTQLSCGCIGSCQCILAAPSGSLPPLFDENGHLTFDSTDYLGNGY